MDIAKYYVSLGLSPTKAFMKDVDLTLKALEKKLSGLRMGTGLFKVDQKKLEVSLGNALDIASKKLVFEITNFKIDRAGLQNALSLAQKGAGSYVSLADDRAAMLRHLNSRVGGHTYINTKSLSPQEWNRREGVKSEEWNRRRAELRADQAARLESRRPRVPHEKVGMGVGGAAGIASRMYGPAIALAAGGYGLSWLNKKNQEIVSTELGANAVLGKSGPQDISWLKDQANKVGFNWLEAAPEFTGFMGAASPLMGHEKSKETFQAFNEFATTRHAPAIARKRALMALKQMASKGTVMSEELFLQLGEAQGFTELPMMFAEALQQKTGGSLKGADAAKFLKDQMKLGKVKTGDILPLVTQMMSAKAAPTLAMSSKSSQAEEARFQNASNAQVTAANKAGVETGYARLFKSFTVALEESTPVVEGLAKAFDEISKYVAFGVMLPQSIKRAFEGRDSWVADAMGEANVKTAKDLYEGLGELTSEFKTIFGTVFGGWKLIFEEFGGEMLIFLGGIKNFFLYTMKAINAIISGDLTGATNASSAIRATLAGKSQEEIEKIAKGAPAPTLTETAIGMGSYLQYTPLGVIYKGVTGAYGHVDETLGISSNVSEKVNKFSLQLDAQGKAPEEPFQYGFSVPLSPYETPAERYDQDRSRAAQAAEDTRRFQESARSGGYANTTGVMPMAAIPKATMELIIKAEDIEGAPSDTFAFKIASVVREQLGNVFTETQANFILKESH